ncbi:MAG TPA: thiamine pyrophosphate-binding protein, partial [Mycobacterium sp.]
VDVADIDQLPAAVKAALDVDGPSVISLECAADEVPPFAPFLTKAVTGTPGTNHLPNTKEHHSHVTINA